MAPSASPAIDSRESDHRLRERLYSIEKHGESYEANSNPLFQQMASEVHGEAKDILGSINFLKASNDLTRKHANSFQERFEEPRQRMAELESLLAGTQAAFKEFENEAHTSLEKIQHTMAAVEYGKVRVRDETEARSLELHDLRNRISENRRSAVQVHAKRAQEMEEEQREIRQCQAMIEHEEKELAELRRAAYHPTGETQMLREHLAMVRADRMAHTMEHSARAEVRHAQLRKQFMPRLRQRAASRQDYLHELQWLNDQAESNDKSQAAVAKELGRLFGALSPTAQGAASMLEAVQPRNREQSSSSSKKECLAEMWQTAAQNDLAASLEHYDRLVCRLRSAAAEASGPRKLELLEALGKFEASPLAYLSPCSAVPSTTVPASSTCGDSEKSHGKKVSDPAIEGVLAEFRQDASGIFEEFECALGLRTLSARPSAAGSKPTARANEAGQSRKQKVVVPRLRLSLVPRDLSEDESSSPAETKAKPVVSSDLLAACASKLAASADGSAPSISSPDEGRPKRIKNAKRSDVTDVGHHLPSKESAVVGNDPPASDRDQKAGSSWPKMSDAAGSSPEDARGWGEGLSWPKMGAFTSGSKKLKDDARVEDQKEDDLVGEGQRGGLTRQNHQLWPEMTDAFISDTTWPAPTSDKSIADAAAWPGTTSDNGLFQVNSFQFPGQDAWSTNGRDASSSQRDEDDAKAPSKKATRDTNSSQGGLKKDANSLAVVNKSPDNEATSGEDEADIDAVSKRLIEAKKKIEGVERDFLVLLDDLTRSAALGVE